LPIHKESLQDFFCCLKNIYSSVSNLIDSFASLDGEIMDKKDESTIGIWVNPLRFFSLEEESYNSDSPDANFQRLIRDLRDPKDDDKIETIQKRYKLITKYDDTMFIVPANNLIIEKLVWPLRAAKQAFCLGNYLGCIALCGTVAEMTIIFLFDIASININGSKLDDSAQKKLFGNTFEKLGQERRIEILEAYEILNKDLAREANQIRGIRRSYLHILSKEHINLEKDAENIYKSTSLLLGEMITLKPGEKGKINVPPHLVSFLAKNKE
jgi:hypothetical protein